ncbi:LysR family transcriptional regulator [Pigmentiphaga sp. H8]|uniref:LysR family transcriptional regulator n=1 Tax=unclassified Pigmentiphaga TaxID=2626614 RepID=UPI000F59872D|nr:LysR substrate-binding domain-containing protein [Pigmentiphaga sp. H8]AZG11095.1 LysR family transcriptional regulator [Pigmentiphaga sp. H8]
MIELRHLRYFVVVAEELHFSRAAARLNMSQPPLSQQIKMLEAMIGARLFVRTKRSVVLTNAGRDLYEQVVPWLRRLPEISEQARRIGDGEQGNLVVACSFTTCRGTLPKIIRTFTARYPSISVRLQETPNDAQIDELMRGLVDVAVMRLPVSHAELEAAPLYDEALVVALPRGHALAGRHRLRLGDLEGQTFVNASRRPVGLFQSVTALCRKAGFEARVLNISANANTAVGLVGVGMGIALVPESMRHVAAQDVVFRPLADSPRSTVAAVRRRDHASAATQLFMDIVADELAGR